MCSERRDWSGTPGPDEICVWQFVVDHAAGEPTVVTQAELRVAAGFLGARARGQYLTGRTLVRRLLGRLLGRDPLSLELVCGPGGKPALQEPVLAFNVSHAGDVVLIAVSRPRRLGVDVERIRPGLDWRAVAEQMVAPADRDALARVAPGERARAFFRYWTRYEAVAKARGDGVVLPLRDLVDMAAGFDVLDLDAAPGYVGAVAADGTPWHVVRCA